MPSGHRPQPPVGTARVAISGTGTAGNPFVNVFWLSLTASTHVIADLKNIIDTMVSSDWTAVFDLMSSDWTITAAKASWLYASGNSLEYTGSYSAPGHASATAETDAVCAVINWSISDYYRGGHPRTYIPGVPTADVVNGRSLTSGFQTSLAAAANTFITDCNALTHGGISAVALGTVRFASGNAWLSPPVFRAYNGASVRAVLGTQRRRYAA
jgi:hypothetical protein